MKLDKLYKLLKDGKSLIIEPGRHGEAKQWAGNKYAMYALPGMPEFTPETLLAALGVPATDYNNWNRVERIDGGIQNWLECYDYYSEPGNATANILEYYGDKLQPIEFQSGTYLVKTEYLKPLTDTKEQVRYYLLREKSAIVACDGIFPVAVIMPAVDQNESIADEYKRISAGIRKASTTLRIDHPEYFNKESGK